jgi:paraquat-inducible protein A
VALVDPSQMRFSFMAAIPLWARVVVPTLILVSTVLNVIALLPGVPFLEIDSVILSSLAGPYSILHVVQLLWDHKLYPLVVLVVGFSILFPPIKLILASVSLVAPMTSVGRERMLSVLGHLGRWSLLDVFVSLLILLVLSDQGFVGVQVHFGLYCFLGAIILSMTAGVILHEMCRRSVPDKHLPQEHRRPLIMLAGWQGAVATVLAIGATAVIVFAFTEPMFQINQFGMRSNTWSLWEGISFLFTDDLQIFAVVMLLFLVVYPVAVLAILIFTLYTPLPRRWRRRFYLLMRYTAEWSMLDVFSLAMVLYLSEQTNFVPLEIKHGTWFLFGAVAIYTVAILWAEMVMRRAITRREAAGTLGFRMPARFMRPGIRR